MKKLYWIFLVCLVLITFLFFSLYKSWQEKKFLDAITLCNIESSQLRFSCYRNAITIYYFSDPKELVSLVTNHKVQFGKRERTNSYAILGPSCHTFYHAVGDFIAESILLHHLPAKNVKEATIYCSSSCTSGCIMGLYKRLALYNHFSTSLLKEFHNNCPRNELSSCSHEIGHILHDKYTYSTLKPFDDLSLKYYGLKQNISYVYTSGNKIDLTKPFDECKNIIFDPKYQTQCFRGIGHNMFIFSSLSPNNQNNFLDKCNRVKSLEKENCIQYFMYAIGLNEAAPFFLSQKFREGNDVCLHEKDLQKNTSFAQCFRGIGSGIGMFVESEYQTIDVKKLTWEKKEELQNDLINYAKLCEQAPAKYKISCFNGLIGSRFKNYYAQFNVYYEPLDKILYK